MTIKEREAAEVLERVRAALLLAARNESLLELIVQRVLSEMNPKALHRKRLYKVIEAAAYLGCSESQVRTFISEGRIPHVALDYHTRVDVQDLELLIEECKER